MQGRCPLRSLNPFRAVAPGEKRLTLLQRTRSGSGASRKPFRLYESARIPSTARRTRPAMRGRSSRSRRRARIEIRLELERVGDLRHRVEELHHLDGLGERLLRKAEPTRLPEMEIDAVVRLTCHRGSERQDLLG